MALVKVEDVRTVADITATKVEDRTDADLLVYVTDVRGMSNDNDDVWTYVELNGDATVRLFWDKTTPVADLKVCFVDDLAIAGWVNEGHPLEGKLL